MRTFILILFSLCFVTIYGTNTESNDVALSINQNFQGSFSYKYGERRIDKELYIHNLGNNVQSYIASKIGMNINVRNLEMRMGNIWMH